MVLGEIYDGGGGEMRGVGGEMRHFEEEEEGEEGRA